MLEKKIFIMMMMKIFFSKHRYLKKLLHKFHHVLTNKLMHARFSLRTGPVMTAMWHLL